MSATRWSSRRDISPGIRWCLRVVKMLALSVVAAAVLHPATAAEVANPSGLSMTQATIVASRFFAEEIGIEGAVAEPSQRGDYWVFPVKIGVANVVAKDPLLVNRFTGAASWAGLDQLNARLGRSRRTTTK